MKFPKPISLSVPATSANLGPGFDILGMAWKLYNHFDFRFDPALGYEISIKGLDDIPFSQDEDLVLSSYKKYFSLFLNGENAPQYQCKMDLNLPLKGGLGSSATAVVAGFCLAREIHKKDFSHIPLPSESRFIYELAMIEGHPDNTSPAYLGGFVLSYFTEDSGIKYIKKKFPNSTSVFALIPCAEIATNESRKVLPNQYAREDVIFQMTRIATWMQFLENKKFSDLCLALQDRMHTTYRLECLSFMEDLLPVIKRRQLGFCLSGSGPTILIFMERKKVDQQLDAFFREMDEIMQKYKMDYTFHKLNTDNTGIKIKRW
jgi:homoserine kinase